MIRLAFFAENIISMNNEEINLKNNFIRLKTIYCNDGKDSNGCDKYSICYNNDKNCEENLNATESLYYSFVKSANNNGDSVGKKDNNKISYFLLEYL